MKRYIVEFFGTLFLAMAVSFTTGNPIAVGLMLMSMIYIGGHISGGHFNPAFSITAWIRGTLKRDDFFIYLAAQTLGAFVALILFKIITNNVFTPDTSPEVPLWISIMMEALLVAVFCAVFLTVNTVHKFKGNIIYGVVIGLTFMAIIFIGGLFNPAIACASLLGNALMGSVTFSLIEFILIYIVGPLLGGVGAAYAVDYLNAPER